MNQTRRDFVKVGAAAGGLAVLPSWMRETGADESTVNLIRRTAESAVPLVCPMCPAGCGLRARLVHGVPVSLSGNPKHPINCGTMCPRGVATLQSALHPARLDLPLVRDPDTKWKLRATGRATRDDFHAMEWNEAIQLLGDRMRDLREKGEAHRVAFVAADNNDTTTALLKRFAKVYGTPNFFDWHWPFGEGPVDAMRAMLGSANWTFDLAHANYVLSLGADWLQASHSPVQARRALKELNRGRAFGTARLVQVEARRSYTGEQANERITIRPGTEGAFALGVAAVIVRSGIMNRSWVAAHTFGFEDWTEADGKRHTGFKRYLAEELDLAQVVRTTGVDLATMSRIAYDLAIGYRPAIVLCDRLPLNDQRAVLALNALIGSIGIAGGVVPQAEVPLSSLDEVQPDDLARVTFGQTLASKSFPRVISAEHLPERLLDGGEAPLDTIIFFGCNPLHSSVEPQRWAAALQRVPFVVAFADFFDATAEHATLVIPSANALEAWQDAPRSTFDGVPVLGLTSGGSAGPDGGVEQHAPDAGDFWLAVAREIGGSMKTALPWLGIAEVIRERVRPLQEVQGGMSLAESVTCAGADPQDFDSFWRQVSSAGGWRGPRQTTALPNQLPTPSGRFEFASQQSAARDNPAGLPHYEPPMFHGGRDEFPLNLIVYVPPTFYSVSEESPWLQPVAGDEGGEMVAELHPSTAEKLSVRDGDYVQVATLAGRATMRARLTEHLHPDVVAVPLNRSHLGQGLWRRETAVNTATLVRAALDPTTGHPLWDRTRAHVARVMAPGRWAAAGRRPSTSTNSHSAAAAVSIPADPTGGGVR